MDYSIAHGAPLSDPPDFNLFDTRKRDAGDDQLFVVFYMGAIVDQAESEKQGRRIARDVEFCRIVVPGDRNNIIDQPATDRDRQRFPHQYAQFQAGKKEDDQLVGTRLVDWPAVSRAQVLEFAYLGVKTVEQIAELRDDVVSRMPGARDLQQIAKAWLGRAKSSAEAAQAVAKEKAMQNRISELENAIKEQGKIITQLREREQAQA